MNSEELIFEVFQRKNTMSEPKTLDQAIRPMLIINLITGMGIFKDSNNRLFKCLEFIYFGLYASLSIFICYFTTMYFSNLESQTDYFLNRELFQTSYFFNGLASTALIVVARINAKKIRMLIALFDDYDQTMEKIGLPKHYKSIYWFQLHNFGFSTMIIILYSLIIICFTGVTTFEGILYVFLFNYPFAIINTCNISFCVWVRYLSLKFEQLNDLLKCIRTKKSDLPQEKKILRVSYDLDNKMFSPFEDDDIRRNKGNAITMSIVKRSHLELFKIANATNTTYGLQLLLLMISTYIFLTSLFYTVYRVVWLHFTPIEILRQISIPMTIIIFLGFQIFTISHNCSKAITEAIVTGEIICKLYGSYACKLLRAEIRNFTLQLVQNPLTFTVYGLFTVDRSFSLRVIQSISTYLVILIQVGDTVIESVRTLKNKNYTTTVQSL